MRKIATILLGICTITLCNFSYIFAYTHEQYSAYQWAYENGITSQSTIETANLNGNITRQAFAKMIVNYLENVIGVNPNTSDTCYFLDEEKITNNLKFYTKKICAYNIMGSNGSNFRPKDPVNRAQLGTVLSRILRGNKYDFDGEQYYLYHFNALKNNGIMNKISTPKAYAKRGDVMIILKRMYEKFGSNVYINQNSNIHPNNIYDNTISGNNSVDLGTYINEDDYNLAEYSSSSIIYTGKDGTGYKYDDRLINLLMKTAEKKKESDLVEYLDIETTYLKNGLDQFSNLDDDEILEIIGININDIDSERMTLAEKEDLIKNFKTGFNKVISENKDRNSKYLKNLDKIAKSIKNDKFGLKEKYKKTKKFMEASNSFLDSYSEAIFNLMEMTLTQENVEGSEEGTSQALGLIGIALTYQGKADDYQLYLNKWATNAIKLLGGVLLE